MLFGPSLGQPGYVPYCGGCSTMMRMHRDEAKQAFVCRSCGLETRKVNGEDMFDRTAPISSKEGTDAF